MVESSTNPVAIQEAGFFKKINTTDTLAPPVPPASLPKMVSPKFNTGRERMISQTYSKQWVPAHPGAPSAVHSSTAASYVAPEGSHQRPASHTRQQLMASSFNLQHPTPTQADQNSIPLPPQRCVPNQRASSGALTAGNRRASLSEHWTRDFDVSLRLDGKQNAAPNREGRANRDAYIMRARLCAAENSARRQQDFCESRGLEVANNADAVTGSNSVAVKPRYVPGTAHQMVVNMMAEADQNGSLLSTHADKQESPIKEIDQNSQPEADALWPASVLRPTLEATLSSLPNTRWAAADSGCGTGGGMDITGGSLCVDSPIDGVLSNLRSKLLMLSSKH